ncbi:hypothetical protein T492DRAFT_833226 [Pavlovales sp. CCMP2436]|nr:hypothetical protein T492DRAFT_833226 [Pavlovales sp. CCMP2436]
MEKKSKVTEEEVTVTIGDHHTPPPVAPETNSPPSVTTSTASTSSPVPPVAPVKAKRIPSEKQRLNYLAANKRRVQILADAKILRVAAASEKAREKAALDEYALAIKLSAKYGFNTNQAPPTPPVHQAPQAPQVPQAPQATTYDPTKMVVSTKPPKPPESTEDPTDSPLDNSSDRVLEESNEIRLTIPHFRVDNALRDIPKPLPAQHMFACFIGPPRSWKTSLSTAMLTQTSPNIYASVFNHVHLYVPATSFASMTNSPFQGHNKVYHELNKDSLERVITKLEVASKKKENSLIIIDDFMSSLKENTLRTALEKLISNRRYLRTYRSIPLTIRKLISALFLFRVSNLRELESIREELVPRDKIEFQALYNHVFSPGADSHQFMFLDIGNALIYNKFAKITVPQIDLPRLPCEPKTIYTAFRDAGIYDDMLNNISGQPVINRSIIPARMTPMLNGRERPTNSTTTQGFASPRGAVSGGKGDQVFYSRVPQPTAAPGPPIIPDASGVLPPDLRPQPPYGSQTPVAQAASMGRFQVNPAVTLAPFIPPPPPSTPIRPLFGPPLPIDFMRSQQGAQSSQSSQSAQSAQSAPQQQQVPDFTFTPTSLTLPLTAGSKAPSTPPAYESDSSRADFEIMRGLGDRRNFPPRSPTEADEQRERLETYPGLLRPIMARYGDMQSIRARIAIGAVFGIHKNQMANVFGRVSVAGVGTFPVVVPLVASTSTMTHLSLNSLSSSLQNQNQTPDPEKTLVIRIPVTSPSANLILPFNADNFATPLALVADQVLPSELASSVTKSVGVQFTLAQVSSITEGTIFTLGDTLKLQDETMSDPQLSTYRMSTKNVGAFVEYSLVIMKTPELNVFYTRVFLWNSDDTPSQIIVKWNTIMQSTIDGISFGHARLSYDSGANKFSAVSLDNPAYGPYTGVFWVVKNQGDDASKDCLGLIRSPSGANPNWATNMEPRPFAYAAGATRPGVKVELYITGSSGIAPRQINFNIKNYVSNANTKYTMLITTANGVEVSFFAGSVEIARDKEVAFYSGIYRPVIWLCGSEITGGVYSSVITPINGLTVLSNRERDLSIADFDYKTIQATKPGNAFFQGSIYGQSSNGTPVDILNSIERLDSQVFGTEEHADLVSCSATDGSWLITTSNTGAGVQCHITPAAILNVNKETPEFTNNIAIVSTPDWSNSSSWRVVSSSTYLNAADFAANNAFNKNTLTFWGSADGTFTSAGVGSQFIGIEYPTATKMHSFRIDGSTRYPGVTAATEFNISGSNSTVFTPIQNFAKTNWTSNNPTTFHITADHLPYRFYRFTVTKVSANGFSATYVTVPQITFITGWSIGATTFQSALPVSTNQFRILIGNLYGQLFNLIRITASFDYNIIITKNKRVVNSGLYRLSSTGLVKPWYTKQMASVLGGRRSIGPLSSTATSTISVPLAPSNGTSIRLNLSGLYDDIYTNPQVFSAEMALPYEMTYDNKSIGVRFAYSAASPIATGTVCVIGDTLALANEGTTADLKASTYTLNMLHPTGAVASTNFSIWVIKNNSSTSVNRDFNWTSLDSPSVVVSKWQTQMRPTISSESFGHCVLQFDSVSGKFSAVYDRNLAYGSFTDVFYQVDRDFIGVGDQSKRTLGLLITNSPNLFWQTNMAPRPFPNIAQCAYYRGGVLIDGRKRLALEVVATGSLGSTKRPVHFDITRLFEDTASIRFEADTLFTLIVTTTSLLFTVGDVAILRTQEPLSTPTTLVNHYPLVYRPVVRVSGDIYNGAISPVSRLQGMSNSVRQLGQSDFILDDTAQATTTVNASFREIYGHATNQATMNVVNTIERLDHEIFGSEEHVD